MDLCWQSKASAFKYAIYVGHNCPSITSWQIDGETVETVVVLIFLGCKITVDGNCSHEIKRHLLLKRKVMTDLDSVLKDSYSLEGKL